MSETSTREKPLLVAVDDGYAQIKLIGDPVKAGEKINKKSIRSSVKYGAIGSLSGEGSTATYIADDQKMTVTDKVAGESTQFDGFHTSSMNRVLINHALVEAGYGGKKIRLYAGLPVGDFFRDSFKNVEFIEKKKENLLKAVQRHMGSMSMPNIVSVDIGCQAVAAFVDYYIPDSQKDTKRSPIEFDAIAVVDVGGRTTDIAVVLRSGEQIDHDRSGTKNIGVLNAHKTLTKLIQKEFDVVDEYSSEFLDRALRTGKARIYGEEVDVSKLVGLAVQEPAQQLTNMVREKLGSASNIDKVIFVGGGAALFRDHLQKLYPRNGFISDDPEFANARGLYKFASGAK